jgi:hypothetical protein
MHTERTVILSRARTLLQRVIASGEISFETLAEELVVPPRVLGQYLSGEVEIPYMRQLCLAKVLIERVPRLARQGYALRGQAAAAIRVHEPLPDIVA